MLASYLFAQRTNWPLTANKFSTHLKRLREEKMPILDLTESNPTQCDFSYLTNDIIAPFKGEENLRYAPSPRGNLKTREAICRYYEEKGLIVFPDQVFLTASTSEAYSHIFRLLVNSGEEVLFPQPSYPLFTFLGDLNDVRRGTYSLVYDGRWNVNIKGIRQVLNNSVKALVIVNPNNPTGSFIDHKELEGLNALCQEHNMALVCDEVFADFAFDHEKDDSSLVNNDRVLTFVLGGVSKTLGLPQMKLSWIIVNGPRHLKEVAGGRLEMITDTYLSVNTPAQNALPLWLSQCKTIQKEIRARIIQNFDFLKKHIKMADDCQLLTTEGGWYAVLKIPNIQSEEEWILTFLIEDHVAVYPGYFFDFDNEAFIVISLLPSNRIFAEGIKRIFQRIKERRIRAGAEGQTC